MELKIKGVSETSKTPNSYEVVIETMEGDMDSFDNLTFGPFLKGQDEDALESLMETVESLYFNRYNNKWAGDFYSLEEIKYGELWLTTDEPLSEKDYIDWVDDRGQDLEDMPHSAYQAASVHAKKFAVKDWAWSNQDVVNSYWKHHVYYYDENREQHDVEVNDVKLYTMLFPM